MQIFEILLLFSSILFIIFHRYLPQSLRKFIEIGALFLFLTLHLLLEGARWQMIPAYLLFLIALATVLRNKKAKPPAWLRLIQILGFFILTGLSVLLPSLFPIFKLPLATGIYTIGTQDIWVKLDRDEAITPDAGDKRNFMVKVWYPTQGVGQDEDPYGDKGGRDGFAKKYGLPPAMLGYLNKIKTHVYRGVSMAEGQFPVIIFSHGYHSRANGYYALLSDLASHGFVLMAINHTYESTGSTFPDGTVQYFDWDYARKIESGTWEQIQPAIESFKQDLSFEERHKLVSEALRTYFVRDMNERWAQDILDVLDKLEEWNREGFLAGKLDLGKVGTLGHSRGGGAAGESLLRDKRLKAGANLDGVQWGQIVDTCFQQPFLYISADWPPEHEDLNQHAYIHKSQSVFYEAKILQSGHSNFMDIPFMIPFRALNLAGSIEPRLAMEITRKLTLTFFDKHLRGQGVEPETLKADYELLEMNVYQAK